MIIVFLTKSSAYAQNFGGGSEPLTQKQQDFCAKYDVNPCTQNNILAKERVTTQPNTMIDNAPQGSNIPGSASSSVDWSTMGIVIVAVIAIVAAVVVAIKVKRPAQTEQV
jgi:hypothetical protein